jgi:alpha-glucosidase (family GH31 glycosyl hydrolase)
MKRFALTIAFAISVPASIAQNPIVALDLGHAAAHAPASNADWGHALTLHRFLTAHRDAVPVAPTTVALLWDHRALYARFQSSDPNATLADGTRPARTDQVELALALPDAAPNDFWIFTADRDGASGTLHQAAIAKLPGTVVTTASNSWTATLTIPWSLLGGEPAKPFRLQLSRVRGVTGEVSSPSAFDYHDGPVDPADVLAPQHTLPSSSGFVETTLNTPTAQTHATTFGLITLPSGAQQWIPRAITESVLSSDRLALAQLEESTAPTTPDNLGPRIRLAELWYDLLGQESFSFTQQKNVDAVDDPAAAKLSPWTTREQANAALRAGDATIAAGLVDILLDDLRRISHTWFADGKPGDVSPSAWTAVTLVSAEPASATELTLHARAGDHPLDLTLSFPTLGGMRLHASAPGHFAPGTLSPITLHRTASTITASANSLTADIVFGPNSHLTLRHTRSAQALWTLGPGGLRVRFTTAGDIAAVDLHTALAPREQLFGLGERFDALDQRGHTITLWQQDAWESTVLNGLGNQAYKPVPLLHSTRGLTTFWDTSYELRADLGATSPTDLRLTAHGPVFDLYLWPGDLATTLGDYTALTGKPVLPPTWAFEPWAGGGFTRWGMEPGKTSTQAVVDVVNRFHALDIPHSAIYAEFVAQADLTLGAKLNGTGVRVLSWGRSQPMRWGLPQMEAALPTVASDDLPLMRGPNGAYYGKLATGVFDKQFPYIDFTGPNGLALLTAYWKPQLDAGIAGTMVDFGDLVPRNARFHDGSGGEEMHNWYAHSYQVAEQAMFTAARGNDFILFARGGTAGTQAAAGQMSGDHTSDFRGLTETLIGGITAATAGFSNWGGDMGGLRGKPDLEVYARWVELATLSPLMRDHGQLPREPWFYPDPATAIYRKYTWLRENLLPYTDGSAQDAHRTGLPILRPTAALADDEYFFGDDLFVAPMHTPGDHRLVQFPAGRWTDLWTGTPVATTTVDASVPLDAIPVYLRAGALMPLRLAPSHKLGGSLTAGEIPALLITPPSTSTSHDWTLPHAATPTHLALEPTTHGFELTVTGWPGLACVILNGTSAPPKSIRVDGAAASLTEQSQHHAVVTLPPAPSHVIDVVLR